MTTQGSEQRHADDTSSASFGLQGGVVLIPASRVNAEDVQLLLVVRARWGLGHDASVAAEAAVIAGSLSRSCSGRELAPCSGRALLDRLSGRTELAVPLSSDFSSALSVAA